MIRGKRGEADRGREGGTRFPEKGIRIFAALVRIISEVHYLRNIGERLYGDSDVGAVGVLRKNGDFIFFFLFYTLFLFLYGQHVFNS